MLTLKKNQTYKNFFTQFFNNLFRLLQVYINIAHLPSQKNINLKGNFLEGQIFKRSHFRYREVSVKITLPVITSDRSEVCSGIGVMVRGWGGG